MRAMVEAECLSKKKEEKERKRGMNGCCNEINEFWVLNACELGMCIDG